MKSMKNMDINALSAVFYDKSNLKLKSAEKPAFTLAEMMVVMLIVSIVLAAMAPVITTKMKRDMNNSSAGGSSIWKWTDAKDAIYFGSDGKYPVLVGQTKLADDDPKALLVLNTTDDAEANISNHILFKKRDDVLGRLRFDYTNSDSNEYHGLLLGSLSSPIDSIKGIGIGDSIDIKGINDIVIGNNAESTRETWNDPYYSIVIGMNAKNIGGGNAVVIGREASVTRDQKLTNGIGMQGAIAIGRSAKVYDTVNSSVSGIASVTAQGAIAIGKEAEAEEYTEKVGLFTESKPAYASIAIGTKSNAQKGGIAIGSEVYDTNSDDNFVQVSTTASQTAIAIGTGTNATNSAIAIGKQVAANVDNSIAVGSFAETTTAATNPSLANGAVIAIGVSAKAEVNDTTLAPQAGYSAIAIGRSAHATTATTVIGQSATATVVDAIAIGNGSKSNGRSSIVFGVRAEASTSSNSSIAIGADAKAENLYSTAIGPWAKAKGDDSVAVGYGASATYKSVAVGYGACKNVTGKNKVCIGASSGPASSSAWATDDVERIFIGSKSKFNDGAAVLEVHNSSEKLGNNADSTVVINGNLIVKGAVVSTLWRGSDGDVNLYGRTSGQLEPMNPNSVDADLMNRYSYNNKGYFKSFSGKYYHNGGWQSDRRLKYVGKENKDGLDKLRQLKVFNYTFKKDPSKEPRVGVIAQDLQKVFPNAVKKGSDGFLTIRMEDMFYAVVNAIKELDMKVGEILKRVQDDKIEIDAKVAGILKQIQNDKKEIQALKKENKELKARIEKLEAKIK